MFTVQKGEVSINCRRLKIVFLGDRSVGKSSIIRRKQCLQKIHHYTKATVGVDFMTKIINYKNNNYKLQLWDTAGQQKYRSLVKGYLKAADVCIFVYDATRLDSYAAIVDWMETFDSVSTPDALRIIVENKIDLLDGENQLMQKQKQSIKSKNKQLQQVNQMPISAKTGQNINELFQQILHQSWFSKTMQDIGTTKTIKSIASQKNLQNRKTKFAGCCQ